MSARTVRGRLSKQAAIRESHVLLNSYSEITASVIGGMRHVTVTLDADGRWSLAVRHAGSGDLIHAAGSDKVEHA